jgi:hypothetical protein
MKPLVILSVFLLSSCAMNRGTRPDGSKYMSMSVLENTSDEERIITPDSFHERKLNKDQTTGGKIVGRTILGAIAVSSIANAVSEAVVSNNAVEAANIKAGTDAAQISSNEVIKLQELANQAKLAELEAAAAAP